MHSAEIWAQFASAYVKHFPPDPGYYHGDAAVAADNLLAEFHKRWRWSEALHQWVMNPEWKPK